MSKSKLKAGFICSAGGSPIFAALEILRHRGRANPGDFLLLADRQCGAIDSARARGIPYKIIPYASCTSFSEVAAHLLLPYGACILLYSRKVCSELYTHLPTWNIHPGLLPAFPGLSAVKEAFISGVSQLGATLHLVTEAIDGGPILAQVCEPVSVAAGLAYFHKVSFIEKTYLILLLLELLQEHALDVDLEALRFNIRADQFPLLAGQMISSELLSDFEEFKQRELSGFAV